MSERRWTLAEIEEALYAVGMPVETGYISKYFFEALNAFSETRAEEFDEKALAEIAALKTHMTLESMDAANLNEKTNPFLKAVAAHAPVESPQAPKLDESKLLQTFDARIWAREWMQIYKKTDVVVDESWMIGWFANAIMCGFDEANRRNRVTHTAENESLMSAESWIYKQNALEWQTRSCEQAKRIAELEAERDSLAEQVKVLREGLAFYATLAAIGFKKHTRDTFEYDDGSKPVAVGTHARIALAKADEIAGKKK